MTVQLIDLLALGDATIEKEIMTLTLIHFQESAPESWPFCDSL